MDRLQKASFFSIFSTIENKHTKCEESGSVGALWKILDPGAPKLSGLFGLFFFFISPA